MDFAFYLLHLHTEEMRKYMTVLNQCICLLTYCYGSTCIIYDYVNAPSVLTLLKRSWF